MARGDSPSRPLNTLIAMAAWIPVVVAVVSALIAGWFAARTKRSEHRYQRLLELERQSAATKTDVFQPLVEGIGEMWERTSKGNLTPDWFEQHLLPRFASFMTWAPIYGADDTIWAYHRYQQGVYADAPINVSMRHMLDLVLALRRELGHPDTKVNALDLMGFRVTDIYEGGVGQPWARLPLKELYETENWTPPWGDRFKYGRPRL
jgi:hypothetical protein